MREQKNRNVETNGRMTTSSRVVAREGKSDTVDIYALAALAVCVFQLGNRLKTVLNELYIVINVGTGFFYQIVFPNPTLFIRFSNQWS